MIIAIGTSFGAEYNAHKPADFFSYKIKYSVNHNIKQSFVVISDYFDESYNMSFINPQRFKNDFLSLLLKNGFGFELKDQTRVTFGLSGIAFKIAFKNGFHIISKNTSSKNNINREFYRETPSDLDAGGCKVFLTIGYKFNFPIN